MVTVKRIISNDKKFSCVKSDSAIFKTVNANYVVSYNLFQITWRSLDCDDTKFHAPSLPSAAHKLLVTIAQI